MLSILSHCLQQNGHNKGVRTVQNFSWFEEIIFVRRFRSKKIPPAVGLMGGHVVQYPPYQGIPIIGTRENGVHFPPGFVLAVPLLLGYPDMKGLIHIPQIELFFREEVFQFTDVNEKTAKHCLQGSAIRRSTHRKSVALACFRPPSR